MRPSLPEDFRRAFALVICAMERRCRVGILNEHNEIASWSTLQQAIKEDLPVCVAIRRGLLVGDFDHESALEKAQLVRGLYRRAPGRECVLAASGGPDRAHLYIPVGRVGMDLVRLDLELAIDAAGARDALDSVRGPGEMIRPIGSLHRHRDARSMVVRPPDADALNPELLALEILRPWDLSDRAREWLADGLGELGERSEREFELIMEMICCGYTRDQITKGLLKSPAGQRAMERSGLAHIQSQYRRACESIRDATGAADAMDFVEAVAECLDRLPISRKAKVVLGEIAKKVENTLKSVLHLPCRSFYNLGFGAKRAREGLQELRRRGILVRQRSARGHVQWVNGHPRSLATEYRVAASVVRRLAEESGTSPKGNTLREDGVYSRVLLFGDIRELVVNALGNSLAQSAAFWELLDTGQSGITTQELADALGYKTRASASNLLGRLRKKGLAAVNARRWTLDDGWWAALRDVARSKGRSDFLLRNKNRMRNQSLGRLQALEAERDPGAA